MRLLYDITHPISPELAVWPGDTAYRFDLAWKISQGDSVNVGSVTMSVHTGTHADAPFHFLPEGAGIGEADLGPYLGPALVLEVTGQNPIPREAFAAVDIERTPRILLKTGGWPDIRRFPQAIPTLAPEVPAYLAERGVRLLGVDVPSVDPMESKDLPVHHALAAGQIAILESLRLSEVPPGRYWLVALPLSLSGADGSPVRAVLLEMPEETPEEMSEAAQDGR